MASDRLPLVVLAGLGLLLLAAVSVFLVLDRTDPDAVLAVEPAIVERHGSPVELTAPRGAGADVPAVARQRAAVDGSAADRASVPVPATTALPELTVAGELVLVEQNGRERRDLDGTLSLVLEVGRERVGYVRAKVAGGRWSATLVDRGVGQYSPASRKHARFPADVADASIGVLPPLLATETCPAVLVDPQQRFAFGDSDVVVRIRCAPSVTLLVEDVVTGASLDQVTVLQARGWPISEWDHPGNGDWVRELAKQVRSPVALEPLPGDKITGVRTCFVHSPGYAWAAIQLDFARGGERAVALERGGELEVAIASAVSLDGVELRLRSPQKESIPICTISLGESAELAPVVLTGLPAGELVLVAETGRGLDAVELGRCDVEVVAGERVSATLVVGGPPEVQKAPLSGWFILPPEWGLDPAIDLDLLNTPVGSGSGDLMLGQPALQPVAGRPGSYTFDLGMMQVGRYAMLVDFLPYGIEFELGPQGLEDLVFEVPPPVEVEVHCVDATTGTTADVRTLKWSATYVRGVSSGGFETVTRQANSDRFRLRVPAGKVGLAVWNNAYANLSEDVDAQDGLQVVLQVRPASAVLMRMVDGETPIPWPMSHYEAEPLEGSGRVESWGNSGAGFRFAVSEPGRYRVEIPEVPGYEPHPGVEVEAREGATVEVVVQRTRLP